MQNLPLFTLLPPFYQKPLYPDIQRYFEYMELEFPIKVKAYAYLRDAFQNDVFIINKEPLFRFPRTTRGIDHLKHEISFLEFLKNKVKTATQHRIKNRQIIFQFKTQKQTLHRVSKTKSPHKGFLFCQDCIL